MEANDRRGQGLPKTPRGMAGLAATVAVALFIVWAWRDGLAWGDFVGALVVGVVLMAVLAGLQRVRGA